MKHIFSLLLFVCICFPNEIGAKEIKFPVSEINSDLKKNAKSVIRYHNTNLEVFSSSSAIMKVSYAITVLNENGLKDSYFYKHYNKEIKIRNISGTLFDAKGERIKRLLKDDLYDVSAISGFSLYDDKRVKYYNPDIQDYPFTVEYSYEVHFNGIINFPIWLAFPNYHVAIVKKNYNVVYPDNLNIRFLEKNIKVNKKEKVNNKTYLNWQLKNVPAIDFEPFMAPLQNFQSIVYVSPSTFIFDGHEGNSSTWKDFGNWINMLNEGRDILPESTIQKAKDLTKDAKDDREKVSILYKYVQNNTRFVNLSIGIGGYQPIESGTVDRLKYGECKALSNYLYSLLKAVDVKSYHTTVRAGRRVPKMNPGFPSNQFNHVFLCVPLPNDTIWIESTSPYNPCGYIGAFTDDREVLVIKKDSSRLVQTPAYTKRNNKIDSEISVQLFKNGNSTAEINSLYYGAKIDEVIRILTLDDTDKEKYLTKRLKMPKSRINKSEHKIHHDKTPSAEETLQIDIGNYGTTMGSNMFINPNLLNKTKPLREDPEDRLSDIYIQRSYSLSDTVVINLEQGITIDGMPNNQELESDFGKYIANFSTKDNQIIYSRYFELRKGTYPKESIFDFYEFKEKIAKFDNQRVALKIEK